MADDPNLLMRRSSELIYFVGSRMIILLYLIISLLRKKCSLIKTLHILKILLDCSRKFSVNIACMTTKMQEFNLTFTTGSFYVSILLIRVGISQKETESADRDVAKSVFSCRLSTKVFGCRIVLCDKIS